MTPHDEPKRRPPISTAVFDVNDPRFSAYLLAEATDEERLAVESILEQDPDARRDFDDLADAVDLVRLAFEQAPRPMTPAKAPPAKPEPAVQIVPLPAKRLPRRSSVAAIVGSVTALGLCLILMTRTSHDATRLATSPVVPGADGANWSMAPVNVPITSENTTLLAFSQQAQTNSFRFALVRDAYTPHQEARSLASASDHLTAFNTPTNVTYDYAMDRMTLTRESLADAPALFAENEVPLDKTPVELAVVPNLESKGLAKGRLGTDVKFVANRFESSAAVPIVSIPIRTTSQTLSDVTVALNNGRWPDPKEVRIEELVNAFEYDDPAPAGDELVHLVVESGDCPWNERHRLVRIGVRAREIDLQDRPTSRLVFIVDSSNPDTVNQLGKSLAEVSNHLTQLDRVAVIDGTGTVALPPVAGSQLQSQAIELAPLTAAAPKPERALQQAFEVAGKNFVAGANNSVVMVTDQTLGLQRAEDLVREVRHYSDNGVRLSGVDLNANYGNTNFSKLVDAGRGNLNVAGSEDEIREAVVQELAGGSVTLARDVDLQVEFNPVRVEAYRMLGYEHWAESPSTQEVAASQKELHRGDRICALLEVRPQPEPVQTLARNEFRYRQQQDRSFVAWSDNEAPAGPVNFEREWLTVRMTWTPNGSSIPVERQVPLEGAAGSGSVDLKWTAQVVAFGQSLQNPSQRSVESLRTLQRRATDAVGPDPAGKRRAFVQLIEQAGRLADRIPATTDAAPASSQEARKLAACDGRYAELLDKISVPEDKDRYGTFFDLGYQPAKTYGQNPDLPAGYWVYVAPHWYIWGEQVRSDAPKLTK
jgi:Ca-activated chloride channel family protein